MIKHVVLWRLKSSNGDGYQVIRAALHAQQGRIPGLVRVEVGRNFSASRRAVDLALVCDFESQTALAAYHRHPDHVETRTIVDPLVDDHWIVDYEL